MPAEYVGKIAYVLTANGALPGVVADWSGERAKVLVASGNRETWTEDRIFWVSEARVPLHSTGAAVDAMASFHDRVEEALEQVDLTSLWEVLVEEGGYHHVEDLAEILFPQALPEHRTATACALVSDEVYFRKAQGGSFSPYSPEAVDSSLKRQKRHEQEEALVRRVIDSLAATLEPGASPDPSHPDQALGSGWLKTLAVDGSGTTEGKKGLGILEGILGGKIANPQIQAVQLLVRLGVFHEDEILGLHSRRIRTVFPGEVLNEAAAIARSAREDSEVADRRTLDPARGAVGPVTIDDPWTKEVDDALMVEDLENGTRVHVLIADPGAGMSFDSLTATEGMNRAATLYLPTGKIPMFPPVLSESTFSLNEGELRPMLDFACDLTTTGAVTEFRVEPVLARVERQLTYEDADRLLEETPSTDRVSPVLRALDDLAVMLLRKREEAGALILARDDLSVRVENGEVIVRRLPWGSRSRRMVAEFMVLACTQAGRFARSNGIPAVYRRQDPPDDPDAASDLRPGSRSYFYRMVRSLRRAEITTQPDFHYGMGVMGYTQVTSPLRRFQDFVVHTQLKGFLKDGRPPMDTERVLRIFGDLETRGDAVTRTEREARRYYLLKALRQSEGDEEVGEVLVTQGSRAIVELEGTGLEVSVPGGGRLNPGARVRLKVLEVDPRRDRVSLRLA